MQIKYSEVYNENCRSNRNYKNSILCEFRNSSNNGYYAYFSSLDSHVFNLLSQYESGCVSTDIDSFETEPVQFETLQSI